MASKNINFSNRLRKIVIDELGWTKTEFAEKARIHINSVTNYLEKGTVPEWDILMRISNLVDVSCDYLLKGEDPAIPERVIIGDG